jgi:hypothetical protein
MATLSYSMSLTASGTICVKVARMREDVGLEGKTRESLLDAVWWAFYSKGITRDRGKLAEDLDALVWDRVPKEVR